MRNEMLSTADFVSTGERSEGKEVPVHTEQTAGTNGGDGARMVKDNTVAPLFADTECQDFRSKWDQIQIGFVDEPRKAVQDADSLVAQTMKRLAEIFLGRAKEDGGAVVARG
jgi:hypothetical protein